MGCLNAFVIEFTIVQNTVVYDSVTFRGLIRGFFLLHKTNTCIKLYRNESNTARLLLQCNAEIATDRFQSFSPVSIFFVVTPSLHM